MYNVVVVVVVAAASLLFIILEMSALLLTPVLDGETTTLLSEDGVKQSTNGVVPAWAKKATRARLDSAIFILPGWYLQYSFYLSACLTLFFFFVRVRVLCSVVYFCDKSNSVVCKCGRGED